MDNLITPIEIVDNPTDPYRITGILEELRIVWNKDPGKTLGQILGRILHDEYGYPAVINVTDDEFVAAIQSYGDN